ncbi:3-hydroxyacyl-CoA dehydrogenase NAD-binding domain-containing protein, partial [Mycobacterium sp. 1245805.9]|uniref:3-hydroxyacyl-CoA dehydrogenase NAD-binding domain-containing protein n=1 Tax=Mycobacterium sp. 1245805.9 TaxID=1856862 RepID=UPI003513F422
MLHNRVLSRTFSAIRRDGYDDELVVESVPEKLEIKIPLWGEIDRAASPGTIFATNSSSYPSRLMAENVRDKTRLCNMH